MGSLRVARKSDGKHLATVARGFGPDPATQDLHQVLRNCKPQAKATGLPRARTVDLVEALEHPAPVLWRDARTMIANADAELVARHLGVDVDRCARRRGDRELTRP